jgi:DNA (cytosine-5)-methyltransferase 1
MNELALFAGAGGGILGGLLLGWTTVCAVEINAYCARRLMQRQNEGHIAPFPIWDDVCTFDGRPWKGIIDVVSGGFPCQDISASGTGQGLAGDRSGLWVEMARIIGEVQPQYALVENSPILTSRGLGTVLGDLAEMGFNAGWGTFTAEDEGAPIERERLFIACTNKKYGEKRMGTSGKAKIFKNTRKKCPDFWLQTPSVNTGMVNGLADYMESVSAIGNGQVPAVVKTAWRCLAGI